MPYPGEPRSWTLSQRRLERRTRRPAGCIRRIARWAGGRRRRRPQPPQGWNTCVRSLDGLHTGSFRSPLALLKAGMRGPTAAHEGIVSDCCGDDPSRRWARGGPHCRQPKHTRATAQVVRDVPAERLAGACRCSSGTRITLLSPCSSVRRWRQRAAQPGGSPRTGRRDTASDTALRQPAAGTRPLPATHGG